MSLSKRHNAVAQLFAPDVNGIYSATRISALALLYLLGDVPVFKIGLIADCDQIVLSWESNRVNTTIIVNNNDTFNVSFTDIRSNKAINLEEDMCSEFNLSQFTQLSRIIRHLTFYHTE